MANQKITDLTAASTPLDPTDLVELTQGVSTTPVSRKTAISAVRGGIDNLSDVDTTTTAPSDGDVLTFNSTSGLWEPDAAGGGGGLTETHGTWTPTVAATTGTLTSASGSGRYTTIGSRVFFDVDVTITTNGTGAGSITATMPFTSHASSIYIFVGREDAVVGFILQAKLPGGSSTMTIFKDDNTYPGGSGRILRLSGTYRKA